MQTLTIDLPDDAYHAALAFPKHERDRVFAIAIITAQAVSQELVDDNGPSDPLTTEDDLDAIGRGLQAAEAGEVISGDLFFAQLRQQLQRQ